MSFNDSFASPKRMVVIASKDRVPVRDRFEKDSAKLGDLTAGDEVDVYDKMEDGAVMRARVVIKSGALSGREGWLTLTNKDGSSPLEDPPEGVAAFAAGLPPEALAAARKAFSAFDVDDSGALSAAELKEVLTRSTGSAKGNPFTDAEVEDILATFDANGDGVLQFEEFAVLWCPTYTPPPVNPNRESFKQSAGQRLLKIEADEKGKGAQASKPSLKRVQTSSKLAAHVSHSFARKAKNARGTFSFKRKGTEGWGSLVGATASVLGSAEPEKQGGGAKKGAKKKGSARGGSPKSTPKATPRSTPKGTPRAYSPLSCYGHAAAWGRCERPEGGV